MKSGHSPELMVLLQVCTINLSADRKSKLVNYIAEYPLNWERLYTLATWHRLTPFLYRTLQDVPDIPEGFLTRIQNDCRLSAADTLLKLHEYHQVATLLTKYGIEHMAYKGVFFAKNCYPDSSLRVCGDIDILIGTKDAPKAIRLLQLHKYHLNQLHTSYWNYDNHSLLDDLPEVSLFKPFFGHHFDIDLHWSIVCFNKHYKSFQLSDSLSHPTFATELHIVLLVTHHGLTNLWQRIYYINDLYFLLNDKVIDWTWLLQTLRQHGLEKVFLMGLLWCHQIWELPLPDSVKALVDGNNLKSLLVVCERKWEENQAIEGSNLVVKQLIFFTKAQTQFNKLLKIYGTFLTSRVFRASIFKIGKRMIYIPENWGFITIFIRATRSLYRFTLSPSGVNPAREQGK